MNALDVAYKDVLHVIEEYSPVHSALVLMSRDVYRLIVVSEDLKVKGLLSIYDVLAHLLQAGREGLPRALRDEVALVTRPATTVRHDVSLEEALKVMVDKGVGCLALTDETGVLRGVLTEGRILQHLKLRVIGLKAKDVMSSPVIHVDIGDSMMDAVSLMASHRIKRVPVFLGEEVYGVITGSQVAALLCDAEFMAGLFFRRRGLREALSSMHVVSVLRRGMEVKVHPDTDLCVPLGILRSGVVRQVFVDEDGKTVGILTARDMVVKAPKVIGVEKFLRMIRPS